MPDADKGSVPSPRTLREMPRTPPVNLAGEEVSDRHICLLHRGTDELFAQLESFIVQGLDEGDRELHVVEDRVAHGRRLRGLGIDVPAREATGQLELREWSDAYMQEGAFSRVAMLAYLRHNLDASHAHGYERTRYIATMDWAKEGSPDASELVLYESQVDDLLRTRRDVVVCAYDLDHHSAAVVAGVIDAHGVALSGGVLRPRRSMTPASPRDRILAAAHDYFHNVGIRATGVDTLIEAAGVAKATFYRHFPSKDDLVVAWLSDDRPRWFYQIRDQAEASSTEPEVVIQLIFEGVARWIEEDGFRGCAFLNAAVEITGSMHPARPIIRAYLDEIESYIRDALVRGGHDDAAERAAELSALLAGGIASCVAQHAVAPALAGRDAAIRLLDRPGADNPDR